MNTKFIVVTGGVISGIGKGVTTASLGKIFKEHGYKTTLIKIDPYINYDAGTLRPTEHGEVWVTEDGGEIDQDLGTYERFINEDIPKHNNITTGQIYHTVIERERKGEYLGTTVQFAPHIIDEVVARIKKAVIGYDIAVIEVGGTVGDYENVPFLFALKSLEQRLGPGNVSYVLVTYLPIPAHIDEMKTKPTQQAIRHLSEHGIMPNFIICRSKYPLDDVRKRKIERFAHIASDNIIAAEDVSCVYAVPLLFEKQQLGEKLLTSLQLPYRQEPRWEVWQQRLNAIVNPSKSIKIAIVGKYLGSGSFDFTDSYISIYHALIHAGAEQQVSIDVTWIDAASVETGETVLTCLDQFDGIIIPPGFGGRGVEGKMKVIHYARMYDIPLFGICYGLQLTVVEFARNVCGLVNAHTTEVNADTPYPVIDILPLQKQLLQDKAYGGTMRLGAYSAILKSGTRIQKLYKKNIILERHRHRYEVNPHFVETLANKGLVFSGYHERRDGTMLMEFVELPTHRFFIATQAHPEFKSRLGNPSPLFYGFVQAAHEFKQYRKQQQNYGKDKSLLNRYDLAN
ncbi:MAG: CTP synthase [Candidatus Babeliales bacterium]